MLDSYVVRVPWKVSWSQVELECVTPRILKSQVEKKV